MKTYLRFGAAMSAVVALALPAVAGAAGLSITGDDGQPLALAAGSTAQIRYMVPKMMPSFSGSEGRYSLKVTNPNGQDSGASVDCVNVTSPQTPDPIDYGGNGTYTVSLTTYGDDNDLSCLQPTTTQTFSFTITAGTAVHPPASTLLRRKPGSSDETPFRFSVDINPGATLYELQLSTHPAFDSSGGFHGSQNEEFRPPSGAGPIEFPNPGLYTIIARPAANGADGPWSAPVKVKVLGPFDFNGAPLFFNTSPPNYKIEGNVFDGRSAIGEPVVVSLAKGNGRFRPLAKPKINKDGAIDFKFRQRGSGRYRLRYAFKGSDLVAKGTWIEKVTLGRRLSVEPKLVPAR